MILELCMSDMLKLTNDEQVVVGDVIVRTTTGDTSCVQGTSTHGSVSEQVEASLSAYERRANRSNARAALTGKAPKEPQFWMRAKFSGTCAVARDDDLPRRLLERGSCVIRIDRGDPVLRDHANGKTYCEPCGKRLYPDVGRLSS